MIATKSLQNRYFIPNLFPHKQATTILWEEPPKPTNPKDQRRKKRLQNDENISKEPVFRKSRKRYGLRRERQRREMVGRKQPLLENDFSSSGIFLFAFHLSAFNPFVVGAYNGSAEWSLSSSGWLVGLDSFFSRVVVLCWLVVCCGLSGLLLTGFVIGIYFTVAYEDWSSAVVSRLYWLIAWTVF